MIGDWIIKVYDYDAKAKTGRWIAWRHPDGGRNVARFNCFNKLKRFVRRHCVGLGDQRPPCGFNEVTKEYRETRNLCQK